ARGVSARSGAEHRALPCDDAGAERFRLSAPPRGLRTPVTRSRSWECRQQARYPQGRFNCHLATEAPVHSLKIPTVAALALFALTGTATAASPLRSVARLTVTPPAYYVGTSRSDTLYGTPGNDVLLG